MNRINVYRNAFNDIKHIINNVGSKGTICQDTAERKRLNALDEIENIIRKSEKKLTESK